MNEGANVASVLTMMLGVNLLLAGVWDVYAFVCLTPEDTVSCAAWQMVQKFPPLVLLAGMVLGHILWPLHIKEDCHKGQRGNLGVMKEHVNKHWRDT